MHCLDPRNFSGKRAVVRAPEVLDAREDFVVCRLLPFEVRGRTRKLHDRAQSGRVLTRVQRRVVGGAIEIDDVA
jgi:hypothetical protein